jgi:magnesium transporter
MLMILRSGGSELQMVSPAAGWTVPEDAIWIELVNPTREEETAVEQAVGLDLPTRDDMAEIEASSRLYQENGATVMIATVLCGSEESTPAPGPVTFILVGERLITIRYVHPRSFELFASQLAHRAEPHTTGLGVFLGLLELIVDRTADLLERISARVEETSHAIFSQPRGGQFRPLLNRLGRDQRVNTMARDSLVSLSRLLSFATLAPQVEGRKECRSQLRSLGRDVQSLMEHSSYVSGNITFLLDAALGLINIEQNEITKVFSIYAVVLLPPTLIATTYGMNFRHMPELGLPYAYPLCLLAMLLSAAVPFLWFKKKRWL